MRIPSPDPELSGEALAKEVPNDPNRTGTIYADQFLAHKCPAHFDDLQRRQFFCILDLRRLKYAADEIFLKKDWKLNIMNFAKEYEKSRGLIMLRYGLYEFKNVKPSEEVLKRWRATHNLPDPEPESESTTTSRTPVQNNRRTGVPGTSTKRKAEEELAPKDNALMASTANQNKRRNLAQEQADLTLTGPAPFKKSKRKADETDEPDENQPNKVQKPTPSAAKSKFESILNKAQSGNTSPLKRPPLASFGAQKPSESQNSSLTSKSNPFAASTNGFKPTTVETVKEDSSAGSVLAGHKVGTMPTKKAGNIFSYLSESSANNSGNEIGNADEGETESESEEGDSQEAPASEQPSAAGSVGTNTPPTQIDGNLFSSTKPSTQNLFGQASKDLSGQAQASKGGLFGRVQMGSNGQPLRATTNVEEHGIFGSTKQPATEEEPIKTPAKKPGDYTFNAATTPISFGPPASHIANTPATSFGAESSKEPAKPEDTAVAKAPPALFGAGAPVNPAFQPTTASLFGASNGTPNSPQTKSTALASSIFSGQKSAPTPSNLFSPAAPKLFGGVEKASEGDSSASKAQQKGASDVGQGSVDSTPQAETKETPPAPKEPAPLFGALTATPVATAQSKSLFGNSVGAADSKPAESVGSQSLFGDNTGKSSTSSLFGASPSTATLFNADNAKVNGSGPAKSVFETPGKQPATGFTFGASKPEAVSDTNKAGNASAPPAIFGSEGFKPVATSGPSLFGSNSTTSTSIFGAKSSEAAPAEKPATPSTPSLFGNNSSSSAGIFNKKDESTTAKPSSIFGSTPSSTGPSFVFGAQPTTPASNNVQSSSTPAMIFGAGGNATQTNGGESKKSETQFGSSTAGASTTPFAFSQGSSGPSFTFTAGGNGQSFNNPFASSSAQPSAPVFGSGPSTPAPASTSSSFNFSFGQQGPSTPNPAPVSQGNNLFGTSSHAGSGAPSFSFTGATPPQNNSNMFATKALPGSTGSFLQASNDIPTGANSPFPAPSSLGTTPISGTPEPQSQGEDGEEGAQVQISLTATSEEDETILHEVRAKAIKYVPIIKGSDDEEERKSPWSTQGVGTLRVLKHDHTGIVRVLLRAEPRGHIAMNKALLSDIEYKAKDKTINFVAANDDGSGLETWVLQVKKPDMAQQLAGVLEQHKSANKK